MSPRAGMYNLDYQELNDYADAHLGLTWEQGDASEIAFSNLQVENSNERVFVKWVKNTGLTALLPGSVVMVDVANDVTKNVVQATAASRPAGVVSHRLKNSVPAGGKFCMIYKGVCEVLVDAAYAKNAAVGTGALGVATTVADTDQVSAVGRLLVASTGAGLARVKLETELV